MTASSRKQCVLWCLGVAAVGSSAAVSARLLLQVAFLFLLVTLGIPGANAMYALPPALTDGFLVLPGVIEFVAYVFLPIAVAASVAIGKRWGWILGFEVMRWQILLACLALSYRLPALLAAVTLAALQPWLRQGRRASRVVAWAIVFLLCSLPYDISLQITTAAPHFAPGAIGTPTVYLGEYVQRGEIAYVGGSTGWYYAPSWLWVW